MADATSACPLTVRRYGTGGALVAVLHGGPGAAGYMAPVARDLDSLFLVLEPLQRRREERPLTVATHVDDLHNVLQGQCPGEQPLLIGHSWGAMLALAYAAAYPGTAKGLVLVGCGTFDSASRACFQATVSERTTPALAESLRKAGSLIRDPDVRLCVTGRMLEPLYSFELLAHADETVEYDGRGHLETWRDMLGLQRRGVYPMAFSRITVPVLMLHGDHDPHPGRMIRDSLAPVLPQLEYVEMSNCGHYPWLERHGRDAFFASLREWLQMASA